jgi:NAD-dependent SIR2 family protein deacetylase
MTIGPASGKFAKAICDRCGFKFYHKELRMERKNESPIMVCSSCYDPIPDNIHWQGPHARTYLTWTRPEVPLEDT